MSKCMTFFDLWKSCCLAGRSVILCPWECAPRCSRIPGKTRSITASGKWTCYIVWPMRKHAENDALPQLFLFSPWQAGALITQWVPPAWGTWHAKLRLANPAAFCLGQASFHRSWPHSAITSMHGPVVWHCHTPVVNTYGPMESYAWEWDMMRWNDDTKFGRISHRRTNSKETSYDVLPCVDSCTVCTSSIRGVWSLMPFPRLDIEMDFFEASDHPALILNDFWYGTPSLPWLHGVGVAVLLPRSCGGLLSHSLRTKASWISAQHSISHLRMDRSLCPGCIVISLSEARCLRTLCHTWR